MDETIINEFVDETQQQQQTQASSSNTNGGIILEQDRFLPIANITRVMKRVIPPEGKLSKEAKECIQECITEFLLFITSEASERCAI
uniref:Transcription factor CBF/NF-Y/archaeal histone domain-containing protein n=1 Tax=Meloidogyne javanica TaxID=6303 RepID=A0A915LXC9_MELJA